MSTPVCGVPSLFLWDSQSYKVSPILSSGSCFLGQEAVARSEPSGRRTNSTVKYVTINTSVYKT